LATGGNAALFFEETFEVEIHADDRLAASQGVERGDRRFVDEAATVHVHDGANARRVVTFCGVSWDRPARSRESGRAARGD
jgi:hypothetical protein